MSINVELSDDMRRQFYGSPPISPTTKYRWASRGILIDAEGELEDGTLANVAENIEDIDISPIKSNSDSPSVSIMNAFTDSVLHKTNDEIKERGDHIHMRKRHPETPTQYKLRTSIHEDDWRNIDIDGEGSDGKEDARPSSPRREPEKIQYRHLVLLCHMPLRIHHTRTCTQIKKPSIQLPKQSSERLGV